MAHNTIICGCCLGKLESEIEQLYKSNQRPRGFLDPSSIKHQSKIHSETLLKHIASLVWKAYVDRLPTMAHIQVSTQDACESSSESTQPQRCTLSLPNELVDTVFEFLDGEDQICFALTCRTLYNNYFLKTNKYYRRADNRYHISNLLCTLEKDSPDYYYCEKWHKLRRWNVPPERNPSVLQNWKGYLGIDYRLDDDNDYYQFPVGEDHYLTLHAVRVIMNRHLFGPRHGIPLEEIELDTHKHCPETGASVDMAVRPRIIDNELFLSVRYKLLHPQDDVQSLKRFINQTRWRVCRHLQIGKHWTEDNCWYDRDIRFLPRRAPEFEKGCWPPKDDAGGLDGNVRSCSVCMTDYQVTISRQYDGQEKKGWSIEVSVWHQIGDGRDPLHGGPWFNLACEGYVGGEERQSLPGIVRHRWSKSDGALLDIKGEFVEGLIYLPKGLTTDREGNVVLKGGYDVYGDYYY